MKLSNITPLNRSKRGLINGIGKLHKWLYGTLDSDDGERYDNAILELQNNQNELNTQLSLQISLSKKLISNYNTTITLLDSNQKLIKNRLQYFEFNMNQTINDIAAYLRAQNTLDQIILNCQNLITFLDNLENALMFSKLNTLHTSVISAEQLKHIFEYLAKLYDPMKIIDFKNIMSYYQLAGLQVTYLPNKIVFAIHIPIFEKQNFKCFHLYPIPLKQTIIIPTHPYLILGAETLQFDDMECPIIEDIYVCPNNLQPMFNSCVVSLVKEAEDLNCKPMKINVQTPVIQAINDEYVITVPTEKPIKLHQNCGNDKYMLITTPSLVQIPKNCKVQINEAQFTNTQLQLNGNPIHLPEIQFQETEHTLNENKIQLETIDLEKIHGLQEHVQLLHVPNKVTKLHVFGWSSLSTCTILLTICLILTALWFLRRRCLSRKVVVPNFIPLAKNENTSPIFSS